MKQEILKLIAMKMAGRKLIKEQDLSKQIAKMLPVPHHSLHKKFAYFYEPYNQPCNTKKFMTFDEPDSDAVYEEADDPNTLRVKSTTWRHVEQFIRKEDERVYLFVLNQLRKKLGNRNPIAKKKDHQSASRAQLKNQRIN